MLRFYDSRATGDFAPEGARWKSGVNSSLGTSAMNTATGTCGLRTGIVGADVVVKLDVSVRRASLSPSFRNALASISLSGKARSQAQIHRS
jgi:hypothetical protein